MFFHNKPANIFFLYVCVALMLLGSCTIVKQYPADTPFVYKNVVEVDGNISKDEDKRLELELANYWDDSLKVRTVTQFGVRTIIRNPRVFDSSALNNTAAFMRSYLNSQGYYNVQMGDSVRFDTVKNQVRTTVAMEINVGKAISIDSVAYDFYDTTLQRISDESLDKTLLKKGAPYSKQIIASELDRLLLLLRRSGYYRANRENLVAIVDTTDVSLLEITLDPFEQARQIAEASEKRRINPTADVVITERDTAAPLKKYRIGNIYYYPEARLNDIADTLIKYPWAIEFTQREMTSKQNTPFIHFRPLREHTYLRRGTLYNEERYFKTVNALSQLGAWNQVDVVAREHLDTLQITVTDTAGVVGTIIDSTTLLDFYFFLTPAQKYSVSTDFEVSRNSGTILNGNLLGLANNIALRNRNVWRESIQSNTVVRNGIEISLANNTPLQTFQSSVSHTISIPRFIAPWQVNRVKRLDAYKTVINFSGAYTERRNFFRLRSIVSSWGYEWTRNNNAWSYRPLNIELNSLDVLPGLDTAFVKNPFLRTAFNTGYVVSQVLTYSKTIQGRKPNVSHFIRFAGEEAGAILGRFRGLNNKLYQYLKAEGEYRKLITQPKTAIAYRLFGGIGYNYSNDPRIGQSLPFFKQFVAGGPNSMRAWPLRQLGLGSSLLSDTSSVFKDRFGDVQLEANFEYRFNLATISGIKIGSAFFTDVGNLWNLKSNPANPNSRLTWNRFVRDIAIAAGTGIRFDFNYFLIRLDFAYKVKDPARIKNNGWVKLSDFEWRNKEFEIQNGDGSLLRRNNYAFQLGIGLPF